MTAITTQLDKSKRAPFQTAPTSSPIPQVIDSMIPQFDQMIYSYALFNVTFLTIGCVEFILLLFFFTFLIKSALLAFSLAAVFLTFFSYFILRVYFQTKKADQFEELKANFLSACRNLLQYREGNPESYVTLANACARFATSLDGREYNFYTPPEWLKALTVYFERFSYWSHWVDVHKMKELLFLTAIEENIKLVKCAPTSLEAHAALANAYVTLAGLYVSYSKLNDGIEEQMVPPEKLLNEFHQQFRIMSERAIEEFKIISEFSPEDPWVHTQLAYSYHDLQMPLEEIREYESLLRLVPEDNDVGFKLGVLYFQQGKNAQGLRIYEQLKRVEPNKAEELITFYGNYGLTNRAFT